MRLIMAQRLVRLLDDKTRQPYQPDEALRARLQEVINSLPQGVERPDLSKVTLYKPGVSPENPFGYTGQVPIREQLQMTPGIQQLLKLPPNQVTTEMLEQKSHRRRHADHAPGRHLEGLRRPDQHRRNLPRRRLSRSIPYYF
jgi:type II secretory ATPase GspE/PulE/Tfp pilus assembly ATPase PilB-like protein